MSTQLNPFNLINDQLTLQQPVKRSACIESATNCNYMFTKDKNTSSAEKLTVIICLQNTKYIKFLHLPKCGSNNLWVHKIHQVHFLYGVLNNCKYIKFHHWHHYRSCPKCDLSNSIATDYMFLHSLFSCMPELSLLFLQHIVLGLWEGSLLWATHGSRQQEDQLHRLQQ
jgi:hypothetical protein